MGTKVIVPRKYDSKVVALLAIFLSMVFALEFFPVVGFTDIPVPGVTFTIDWTGIPLILIFFFFGPVLAGVGIAIMGVAIGYRNPIGATFKLFAEFYKIIGIALIWIILRNKEISYSKRVLLYTISATIVCTVGMFLTNIPLYQILFGYTYEAAVIGSMILIPWNVIQSIINVLGGSFLFKVIPEDLKQQFLPDSSYGTTEMVIEESEN